jgi:hypothetical protein
MNAFANTRRQLIADILDSCLTFEAARGTTEWEELTCLEQISNFNFIDDGIIAITLHGPASRRGLQRKR